MEGDLAETADDILRRWIPALLQGLAESTGEEQQTKMMEHCGGSCAEHDFEGVTRAREEGRDWEHLLRLINEQIPRCGDWVWQDGKIRTVAAFCSCRRGQASSGGSWLDGYEASRGDVLSVKAHARYTGTNMSSYRDSSPLTMRSYSLSKLAVMGPILPSPIGYLSTEMIGTISMAVPQKKASSAM